MPTQTLPTRTQASLEDVSPGFGIALSLHLLVVAGIAAAAWIGHLRNPHWGSQDPVAGSIQASMVSALPLPPKQRFLDKAVLTSEKPSIAPTPPPPTPAPAKTAAPPKAKAEPPPKPNEVLIPTKTTPVRPTPKAVDTPKPETPRRVTTPPPPTPKATTGETAGIQIPQSVTDLKNGTATLTVEERAFGDRFAYYIRLIAQKVNQSKEAQGIDPPEARGKRTAIRFTIDRDGTPTDATIVTRSGSATLDTSALRAIQRIDSFGPLPQGDHITITFGFTDH